MEHILPENPGAGWESFSSEDRVRDTTRLGNITPLEHELNVSVGSAGYETRRPVYALSARVLRFAPLPELNMDFRGVAVKR